MAQATHLMEYGQLNEKLEKIITNQNEILRRLDKIEYTISGTIPHCLG